MAKAKWLAEGSNLDLVNIIEKGLAEGATDKDAAKVGKAVAELKERFEAEAVEPSVMGLLAEASKALVNVNNMLDQAGGIYQADIEAAGQVQADEDETAPEVEEAPKKEKKSKKASDEDVTDEAAEEKALTDMTKKELIAKAKELGIKVSKKLSAEEIIAKIEEN